MNRTKKTFYNTVATTLQMVVMQIVSLVVSRKVLSVYGSDLNGVNAILSNMMEWILLLEGGLTTASNVALFKPFVKKDFKKCNGILSATKKKFRQIGMLVFVCGIALAVIYPTFINTNINRIDIFLMFTMMTLSTSFSVFYTRKYALMLNVSQSEYINTLLTTVLNIIGNAVVFVVAVLGFDYLWIRTVYLLVTIFNGLIIAYVVKRKFDFIDFSEEPEYDLIKGTKDVVFQKITGLLRSSAPLIFISVLVSAMYASVYSVYVFIYGFIRKCVLMVVNATQSGIGQLIAEKTTDEVYKVFRVFEYTSTLFVCWLMSVAIPMTMPFIRFYTRNVNDINYIDYCLLVFMVINISVQVFHVPSGIVINMSGAFKEDKNFQIASVSVMLVGVILLGMIIGFYGVLLGIAISSIVLAVLEIHYARKKILDKGYKDFFKPIILNIIFLAVPVAIEMKFLPIEFSIPMFVLSGVILFVCNGAFLIIGNIIFERDRLMSLVSRVKGVIGRR